MVVVALVVLVVLAIDAPLPRLPRVLTILYALTCINQSCQGEFQDVSNWCYLN
jgi:hypothetical protein